MTEEYGNEVDLDSIEDEPTLVQLLDETEDIDERKMIRARLAEVKAVNRAKRDAQFQRREQDREDTVQRRAREAAEQKQRTLAMYDKMAKSAPAGGHKTMDINVYKNNDGSPSSSGRSTPINSVKRDLVEDSIKQRQKDADDRKSRIMAAYDSAAKSGPAGSFKIIDFDSFKKADVTGYTVPTTEKSSCFRMSGGVPLVKAQSRPGTPSTPILPGGPQFPIPGDETANLDPLERAIRARVKACEDQKKRTLMAYDIIAKTGGGGPQMVCLEEYSQLEVSDDHQFGVKHRPTSSFRGGVLTQEKTPLTPVKKASCCSRGIKMT